MSRQDPGPRVLVVEDALLLAMDLEQVLSEGGYRVVGPFGRLEEAVRVAERGELDAALLDLDLRGTLSTPVAYALRDRGIPFVFVTGHAETGILPADLAGEMLLDKPVREKECLAALGRLLRHERQGAAPGRSAAPPSPRHR
jgi:chemotaxis family two-component system sensor kinase Cph1